MLSPIKVWLHGLISAIITGFSTSFLTALGINGANAAGINIDQLNIKQLSAVTIFGGIVGAMAYLRQSPLPDEQEETLAKTGRYMPPPPVTMLMLGLAAAAFTGCATTPMQLDAITQYEKDHADLITGAVSAVSKFCLAQAEKDPVKREVLKADINQVVEKLSRGLDLAASSAEGALTPAQLKDDLKVSDTNVQAFFDALVVVYAEGYERLVQGGKATDTLAWAKCILQSVKTLSDGLNKATS